MKLIKLLPFWLFILLYQFGGNIHFTFLPMLGDKLTTTWIAGIIVGSLSFTQFLLDVPAGFILDRFGYIKMLRFGIFMFIISSLILAFIPGFIGFVLATISGAFGWLFMAPGVNAYILSTAPKEKVEKYIVFRDTFTAAGICFGSLAVAFTVKSSPTQVGLAAAIILSLASIFIWLTPEDTISVHQEIKTKHHHFYIRRNIFKKLFKAIYKLNPASWMLLLQGFCASIFYGAVWFTIPLMIADSSKKIFGMSLGIFDFAILLAGFFVGKFFSRLKENKLVIIGLLIFSLSGLIVGHQTQWLFLFFAFLASAGDEISNVSLWSWLAKLDENHETDGEVSSVISFFIDIGWGLGPVLAGFLYGLFGGELTITFSAIPIFITFLISIFLISNYSHIQKMEISKSSYPKRSRGKK